MKTLPMGFNVINVRNQPTKDARVAKWYGIVPKSVRLLTGKSIKINARRLRKNNNYNNIKKLRNNNK